MTNKRQKARQFGERETTVIMSSNPGQGKLTRQVLRSNKAFMEDALRLLGG